MEAELENHFEEFGISSRDRQLLRHYLGLLRGKHHDSYEHSVRVGSKVVQIARQMDIPPKALFFPGLLHDVGKLLVYEGTLKRVSGFNDEDRGEMARHPEFGYRLLQGAYEFSAQVVVRHHRFQKNPYPSELPPAMVSFSPETLNKVEQYSKIIALADFYDALGRGNDRNGAPRKLGAGEKREILLREKPDMDWMISHLYDEGIFR
jgi:HD-GYP domain-containing protein (c-di-GMP phosphodiesterase class II)